MAQPTNTFDSYDAVGNREDLQDKIYQVSPEKTPVLSAIKRMKATNKTHEWQRDSLATPNKDNAVIEGDDRTGTAITATERVANTMQLFDKVVVTTSTQEAHKKAGRSSEMKYQIAKGLSEIKRDVEAALVSINPAVAGSATVARKAGGLGVLLYTNALHGGTGATAAHTSGIPSTANTAGTDRAFTEALVKTAMQSVYTNSGEMPTMMSMTPSHKGTFSGFAGIAANRYNVKGGQQGVIVGGADVYMSDFGEITVVPNYVQTTAAANQVYILNPDQLAAVYLQGYKTEPLAKTGHSEKEMISCEVTFAALSEKAHAKIDNLTA